MGRHEAGGNGQQRDDRQLCVFQTRTFITFPLEKISYYKFNAALVGPGLREIGSSTSERTL